MKNIILNELSVNFRRVLIPILLLSSMVFMSMLFYPTIAENMYLLEDFLNSSFMDKILMAFGMNVSLMQSILGFYATYSSMFVVLIGSIFFGYFGFELNAKEEKEGTIEYLLARPTTRSQIYGSKFIALLLYVLLFMTILSSIGLATLEIEKKYAIDQLDMSKHNQLIENSVLVNSQRISSWLHLSEEDFNVFVYTLIAEQYQTNQEEILQQGIDVDAINEGLQKVLDSPEGFFAEIKQNTSYYMELFNIADMSEEDFILELDKTIGDFQLLKHDFLTSEDIISSYYTLAPAYFLEYIRTADRVEDLDNVLGGLVAKYRLFAKYDIKDFFILHVYMFLIIAVIASLSFAFSALVNGVTSSPQIVMVAILILYFMNSFAELSPATSFLKSITPFGYMNTNVLQMNYQLDMKDCLILVGVITISYLMGNYKYKYKNFS